MPSVIEDSPVLARVRAAREALDDAKQAYDDHIREALAQGETVVRVAKAALVTDAAMRQHVKRRRLA